MTRKKYGAVEPDILLKKIGILNIQQLIDFETADKSLNDLAPNYLTDLFTRAKSIAITLDQPTMAFSQHMLILSSGKGVFPTMDVKSGTHFHAKDVQEKII